jgi:hypothetical protein
MLLHYWLLNRSFGVIRKILSRFLSFDIFILLPLLFLVLSSFGSISFLLFPEFLFLHASLNSTTGISYLFLLILQFSIGFTLKLSKSGDDIGVIFALEAIFV